MPPKRKQPAPAEPPAAAAPAAAESPSKKKKGAVVAKPCKSEWACMACTFFNASSAVSCEICGTPKGFGGLTRSSSGTAVEDPPEIHLEFKEGKSSKFWKLNISGCTTLISYGRIGTSGQTDTKVHSNAEEAKKFAAKIQAEKEKKGYVPAGTA